MLGVATALRVNVPSNPCLLPENPICLKCYVTRWDRSPRSLQKGEEEKMTLQAKRIVVGIVLVLLALWLFWPDPGPTPGASPTKTGSPNNVKVVPKPGPNIDPSAGDQIRNDIARDTQNRRTADAARKSVNDADNAVNGTPSTLNPDITPVP